LDINQEDWVKLIVILKKTVSRKNILSVYSNLKLRISRNELIKDSFWALLGNFFGKGLSVYSGIILAKILGNTAFGEYSLVKNPIFASAMFFTFGFGYLTTKLIAENIKYGKIIIGQIISVTSKFTVLFSSIISGLLYFFSDFISLEYFSNLEYSSHLKLFAIWNVFNSFYTLQLGILSGFRKYKSLIWLNIILGLLLLVLTIIGAKYYEVIGAILALLIYQIISVFLNFILIRKAQCEIKDSQVYCVKDIAFLSLFKEVLPIGIQEATYSIFSWVFAGLVIKYCNFNEYGLYSVAIQWSSIVLFVPGVLRSVILSHFSLAETNIHKRKTFKYVMIINLIVVVLPALVIVAFSSMIETYYGNSYVGLGKILIISMVLSVQLSLINIYSQLFLSEALNWPMFRIRLTKELILIVILVVTFDYFEYSGQKSLVLISGSITANFIMILNILYYYQYKLSVK